MYNLAIDVDVEYLGVEWNTYTVVSGGLSKYTERTRVLV